MTPRKKPAHRKKRAKLPWTGRALLALFTPGKARRKSKQDGEL